MSGVHGPEDRSSGEACRVAASDAEDCLRKVIQLCTEFVPRHWKWFHPIDDVQVHAPMLAASPKHPLAFGCES